MIIADSIIVHAWKHRFTSECISPLHVHAFGTNVPTYAAVLQLDEQIRSFPIPPILRLPEPSNGNNSPVRPDMIGPTLQRYIVFAMREMSELEFNLFYLPLIPTLGRLYLHRVFFAKAIIEHPENPLQSPYRDSIEAVFHCAQTFVERMWNLHSQAETICSRLWFLWAHMFSCSVSISCCKPGFI